VPEIPGKAASRNVEVMRELLCKCFKGRQDLQFLPVSFTRQETKTPAEKAGVGE
jgi:hypothetical protein